VFFDIDPTKQAVRQRELANGLDRPAPQRRLEACTGPGQAGRKRGERVRSRMTVLQAHTHEWLGTFGFAGQGQRKIWMPRACDAIVAYLQARSLPVQSGVVRLDGEFGWAEDVRQIQQKGLGYLGRCADYELLHHPQVRAALCAGTTVQMTTPDSGVVRQVFDVPDLQWKGRSVAIQTRLVVTRRPWEAESLLRVGKRIGEWVYELFITDQSSASWDAAEAVTLYLGRGHFERSLSEEDHELLTDCWLSTHSPAEEIWQILNQWVWNHRIWSGALLHSEDPLQRQTDWTVPMQTIEPVCVDLAAVMDSVQVVAEPEPIQTGSERVPPSMACAPEDCTAVSIPEVNDSRRTTSSVQPPQQDSMRRKQASRIRHRSAAKDGRFAPSDFVLQADGTLCCPAGQSLRPGERKQKPSGTWIRFEAKRRDCHHCPLVQPCRGSAGPHQMGRRVELPEEEVVHKRTRLNASEPASAQGISPSRLNIQRPLVRPVERTEARRGSSVLQWLDVDATRLRRELERRLDQQRVQVQYQEGSAIVAEGSRIRRSTRDQRAHRRLTWHQRLLRNARRTGQDDLIGLRIMGLPREIAEVLGIAHDP
jgi:hypothetical protein